MTLKDGALRVRPCTLRQACDLVDEIHRHHKRPRGHRFSIRAERYNAETGAWVVCGVAIVGRPVARAVDPYLVFEVIRVATDGTKNACSILYGRAAKAAQAMGAIRIQTYTLESEPGTSLRAVGWRNDGVVRRSSKGWNNRSGRLLLPHMEERKVRWSRELNPGDDR